MAKAFDIDSSEVVEFTNKLEKMHKAGLPSAVRETLNMAAFQVKGSSKTNKNTLRKTTQEAFTVRRENFFRVTSTVKKAGGFNMDKMFSLVGFTERRLKGSNNFSVKNLKQQEQGGEIDGRNFVPLDTARVGKNHSKQVKKKFRLSNINQIINAQSQSGANEGQKYLKAAIKAGKGGFALGSRKQGGGNRLLFYINSIKRVGQNTKVNSTPVYAYQEGRSFSVSEKNFLKEAAVMSSRNLNEVFKKQAERQIKRLLNK